MILSNLLVHTVNGILKNTSVEIQAGKIHAITTDKHSRYRFPENYSLVPGFIDLHTHGANGADVMDASCESLEIISTALAVEGTTAFLATTMSASIPHIDKVMQVIKEAKPQGAQLLGVHLEGPFLSPTKIGAQSAKYLLDPEPRYIDQWQTLSANAIKLVTLAPELSSSVEFILYLKQKNIIAAIGHTDATFEQTQAAIAAGCSYATHLFNAMRGLHQREPGALTAALLSKGVMAECILDGVHLHPAIVDLAYRLKGPDHLALVTDAMRAKCLSDGVYELGGQKVEVNCGSARLSDGTLAGSLLTMSNAVKNAIKFTGCGIREAIIMASENPAKVLGIFDRKGSIALNKDADLTVLDENFDVVMTVVAGEIAYNSLSVPATPTFFAGE